MRRSHTLRGRSPGKFTGRFRHDQCRRNGRRAARYPRAGTAAAADTAVSLIEDGLAHCRRLGLGPVVVAIPETVPGRFVPRLLQMQGVKSILLSPDVSIENHFQDGRIGRMLPQDYSWQLPSSCGPVVLYVGPRRTFSFRMARRALARRSSSVLAGLSVVTGSGSGTDPDRRIRVF